MPVVATAGHVDHGKSALVQSLTGMQPDRWEAERRRGLTIDLGYAWTRLPQSGDVAFVDVPGHRRFIGNMLSGVGPAAAVLFVVAADGGWSAQSEEHLRAVHALRLRHGVLAVTRSDLADPAPALAEARQRLSGTSLDGIPGVGVSVRTGAGIDRLRDLLDACCADLPAASPQTPVRLWVDRSFTVRGAGTVVTGTLPAGSVAEEDHLLLSPAQGGRPRPVVVRSVQSLGRGVERVDGPARVALNLRGIEVDEVHRGQALLGAERPFWLTAEVDVLLDDDTLPAHVHLHVGTAALPARMRTLSRRYARLLLEQPLPLAPGDRLILRDPGREGAIVGAQLIDGVAPPLRRSGAARRRAAALAADTETMVLDGRPVSAATATLWRDALTASVHERRAADPLDPWLPLAPTVSSLKAQVGLPDRPMLLAVAAEAGLTVREERVGPGAQPACSPEGVSDSDPPGLGRLLDRLARDPLDAPTRPELAELGVGPREIAAASTRGALLRLPGDVLLGADAEAAAVRRLAALPAPFTTSQARQAWGVSRRVAIALLEHLDARGRTRRGEGGERTLLDR